MAALVLASTVPELLRARDIVWFADNRSAASALVKAGSTTETMGRMALIATAALMCLRARVWTDWAPSGDNPADPLSRGGLQDPLVAPHVHCGAWEVAEPIPPKTHELDYESLRARMA